MKEIPNLTSPRVIRELLTSYGIKPQKQWGQNFLIDGNIVRKISAALAVKEGDRVIEIGPGAGALTTAFALQKAELLVVEIDRGLVEMLINVLQPYPNVRIINEDALNIKWSSLLNSEFGHSNAVKLVSNLPYVISGPFMHNLFNEAFPFESAVIMFQKEVAHRLAAGPGDKNYSALSVLCGYYCRSEILFEVASSVFWPRPKIGSAVIRLTPKEPLLERNLESHFRSLARGLFMQRRKTILNNLANYMQNRRDAAARVLASAGIKTSERPENLSVEQFALLAGITYNYDK